jgi:hypothetical protein
MRVLNEEVIVVEDEIDAAEVWLLISVVVLLVRLGSFATSPTSSVPNPPSSVPFRPSIALVVISTVSTESGVAAMQLLPLAGSMHIVLLLSRELFQVSLGYAFTPAKKIEATLKVVYILAVVTVVMEVVVW